jgi:hypothetical protein
MPTASVHSTVPKPHDRQQRQHVRWHDAALVFFGAGLVAGLGFAAVGPIFPIRVLGSIALTCAALGTWVTAVALRGDDPEHWAYLCHGGRALLAQLRARLADGLPRYAAAENFPA